MARRAKVIEELDLSKTPYLHLDLGNFCSTKEGVSGYLNTFLWQTMEDLGVAATTVGRGEAENWPQFKELIAGTDIPLVSTNLTEVVDGRAIPIGKPYVVLERAGIRIGLVALLSPAELQRAKLPDGVILRAGDPKVALLGVLDEVREQADLIVLMSQLETEKTDELIRSVSRIDVALYGMRAPHEESAARLSGTIVNRAGAKGQYLGKLVVDLDAAKKIQSFDAKNPSLDKEFDEDAEMAARVAEAKAKSEELLAEFRKQKQDEFESLFK